MSYTRTNYSGFSLIEALIVAAIGVTIFAGLFGTFTYTFELLAHAKAKTTAVTIANQRMEYFRSLPYSEVGTVSGIPAGSIPQHTTVTLNEIVFDERVLVEYVDDPADGLLTATTTDSNGIPADYKRIKIEVSWTYKENTKSIILTSNIVPRSIETTDGGGTVRVNVLDADSTPLAGAFVQLINNTTTTTIDVTKSTDSSGAALFSGAPAASNYEVVVTAPGYSTDQTYQATVANPNPITAPFAVLEADISTVTFQIGELSDIDVAAYSAVTDQEVLEEFTGATGVATSTDVEVVSGVLRLAQSAGVYASSGEALLTAIAPSPLLMWGAITLDTALPADTTYSLQVGTVSSSTFIAIPDSDLPGNASGFSTSLIDLSALDIGTYPSIVIRLSLQTTNSAVSPSIDEVAVYYREAATPISSLALSLRGNKVIGSDLSASPIYKTALSGTTDGGGELAFSDVEFDLYTFTIPATYTVRTACPSLPLSHEAGIDSSLTLVLSGATTHSLRATVLTSAGTPVPGARVVVSRSGFSETAYTNICGQIFIHAGVLPESDYEVSVSKPGYVAQALSTVTISGNSDMAVTLVSE
jgi:Carboxypeptidase regulatory-like domain